MKHIFILCLTVSATLAAWIDPIKTRASKARYNNNELPQIQLLCNDVAKKLSIKYTTQVQELSQSFDMKLKTLQETDSSEDSPEFKSLIKSYDDEIKKALDNHLANYSTLLQKCKNKGVIVDENSFHDINDAFRPTPVYEESEPSVFEQANENGSSFEDLVGNDQIEHFTSEQPQGDYDWDAFNHINMEQTNNIQEDNDETFTYFVDKQKPAGKIFLFVVTILGIIAFLGLKTPTFRLKSRGDFYSFCHFLVSSRILLSFLHSK